MAGATDAATPAAEPKAIAEADASADLLPTWASTYAAAAGSDAETSSTTTSASATASSEPAPDRRARASAVSTSRAAPPPAPAPVVMTTVTMEHLDRDIPAPPLLLDMLDSASSSAGGSLSPPESPNRLSRNKQTKFFKHAHIFVEMDELREKLERDLVTHRFERVSSCKKLTVSI